MKILSFLKKYYRFIIIYLLGSVSAFLCYRFIKKFSLEGTVKSSFLSIIQYPVFTKDNNPITLGKIGIGISLIILGYHLSKKLSSTLSEKLYSRFDLDRGAISSLENLTFYILFCFFTLFALNTANVPLTMFTVLGGALAIGVGFGSQNIINNFICGIIIQIERPVKVGDLVEIDGSRGVVENIGARRTVIRSTNGTTSIFPNSMLLEKKLLSFSYQTSVHRCDVKLVLPANTNLSLFKEMLLEELGKSTIILKSPEPSVIFSDFIEAVPNIILIINAWIDLRSSSKTEVESEIRFLAHKLSQSK